MFFRKKDLNQSLLQNDFPNVGIFITDRYQLDQLRIIDLSAKDLHIIKCIQPFIEQKNLEIVEAFYSGIDSVPILKKKISEHSSSSKLRQTLKQHINEMFEGRIDDAYVEKRRRVARMHTKIGLYPQWYLAAFQMLEKKVREIVYHLHIELSEQQRIVEAIGKIMNFEQQLVLEEYDIYAATLTNEAKETTRTQVKAIIGDISTQLDTEAEQTLVASQELMASTEQLNKQIETSISEASLTIHASQQGQWDMQILSQKTIEMDNKTSDMSQMVQALDSSSSEIYAVIEMVKNIAGQTNLLALNSAIEAARAGQHGKGFAVVADEVRKLADQTKHSVEQIANLISVSSGVTTEVIKAIQDIQILMKASKEQTEKSIASFENINSSMNGTISNFQVVSQQIEELTGIVKKLSTSSGQLQGAANTLKETVQSL